MTPYVPMTPPTSISAVATRAPSSYSTASDFSMGTSTIVLPLPHFVHLPTTPSDANDVSEATTDNGVPVEIRVRKLRILLVAIVVVVALVACIARLLQGVPIATGGARFYDPKLRRAREDDLNFYFGTTASLVAKFVEVAAVLMLPIVMLVLLTERWMLNDAFYWRLGVLLFQGFVIALLTNAFTTTYVTASDPVVVQRIMIDRDVVAPSPQVAARGLNLFLGTNTTSIPRRRSTDTMLRTALVPPFVTPPRRRKCHEGHTNQSMSAHFGFSTSGDGLQSLASNGVAMNRSLNLSIGDWLGSTTTTTKTNLTMPHNTTTAANLAIHAIHLLIDRLQIPFASASTVDPLPIYAQRARDASTPEAFLRATAEMLNASFAPQDEFGFFFAPANATLQFSMHARGSIRWDSLTLTMPFRSKMIKRSLVATQFDTLREDPETESDGKDANGDVVYQVFPTDECGTRGCWLSKPRNSLEADTLWRMRPEVVGYSRCRATFTTIGTSALDQHISCPLEQIVNHSIVIGALGSTLLADDMVEFGSEGFTPASARVRRANVTNLRRVMTITVGFLTWNVENLSDVYGVKCARANCDGLWYPMTPWNHMLVGAEHVIGDEFLPIGSSLLVGQPLVSVVTDLRGGSFLSFQNLRNGVHQVTSNGTVEPIDPTLSDTLWPCSRDVEVVTDSIVFNRWFMDHSLQEAYTTGLFHVYQFGVNHTFKWDNRINETIFDLYGNVEEFEFIAHIPLKGALVSVLAGVLFLVSVVVVVCAGKRRECAIRDLTDVHRVARVHLVEQFFPKVFLNCTMPQGQSLGPFRIVAMQLHRTTPDGDEYVTLPQDLEQQNRFAFRPVEPPSTFWSEPSTM